MTAEKLTEEEWRDLSDLRAHWNSFCDADPFPGGDTFIERMEKRGYAELVPVTAYALEEPFASERGIEKGGMMWQLTEAGRTALAENK